MSAQVVDALRRLIAVYDQGTTGFMVGDAFDKARAALAAADAQPAQPVQEPVYWQWRRKDQPWRLDAHTFNSEVKATTDDSEVRALYAAPPQPAPLTEGDVLADLKRAAAAKWRGDPAAQQWGLFARAAAEIERLNAQRRELQAERETLLARLAHSGVDARHELVAAWNDLPDALRFHPGLARLYRAAQRA